MSKQLEDTIKKALAPAVAGQGKILSLGEAVKRYVTPGMTIHLASGIGGPSAAICELIRQYKGKNPDFTIVQSTLSGHALNMVQCKLAKKLVCSICADISASSRPSKIVQKAYAEKSIEMENWSLYSLQQRLMAGAFGFPFLPTKSVLGSTIATDNAASFQEMKDPFGSDKQFGIVKALNPDISFIHASVADADGNIIPAAPYGEDLWGALAATQGAIVTVERIVPTDFIRRYAALVKVPAYAVKAVCAVPLGVHPFSYPNPGLADGEPYEQDLDFLNELHNASLNNDALEAWIKEWITDCGSHDDYLKKLGAERVESLKARSRIENRKTITFPAATSEGKEGFNAEDVMLVVIARETVASVKKAGHKVILGGAGSRGIAGWLAYYQLRAEGYEVELVTGNGQIGFTPMPGESILSSQAGVESSKMLTDTIMTQGVVVGGANNKCLSVLGAGQVDRNGNINSTVTSTGKFLVGSGGANDAVNAHEVIVALDQSKDRFAEKLPYITGRGNRVTTVISNMGIYRKGPDDELCLAACFPTVAGASLEDKIKEVEANCGWPMKRASTIDLVQDPTTDELELLRWLLTSSAQ